MNHKEGSQAAFQSIVIEKLEKIENRLGAVETNIESILETQQFLVQNAATHEELHEMELRLRSEIGAEIASTEQKLRFEIKETEQRLRDHTSREVGNVRGEIISITRKIDDRIDETVISLKEKQIFSPLETQALLQSTPFAKPAPKAL